MGLPAKKKEGSGEILQVLEFKLMSHCVVTLDFFGCFCPSQHVASKVQKYMSDFVQILIKKDKRNQIKALTRIAKCNCAFQVSI